MDVDPGSEVRHHIFALFLHLSSSECARLKLTSRDKQSRAKSWKPSAEYRNNTEPRNISKSNEADLEKVMRSDLKVVAFWGFFLFCFLGEVCVLMETQCTSRWNDKELFLRDRTIIGKSPWKEHRDSP